MDIILTAAPAEWETVLKYFNISGSDCRDYPYGHYFFRYPAADDASRDPETCPAADDASRDPASGHSADHPASGNPDSRHSASGRTGYFVTGKRKTSASAATQYIIDHFAPDRIILIGSAAGIDTAYHVLDIIIPDRAVQTDTTVWELDRLIRPDFAVDLHPETWIPIAGTPESRIFIGGTVGSADKAVVMWPDYLRLEDNGITIADTESAAVAWVCGANGIPCLIIRGISDFPEDFTPAEAADMGNTQIQNYLKRTPEIIELILDRVLPWVLGKAL